MSDTSSEQKSENHIVTIDEVLEAHPNTSPVPVLPQLSVALGLLIVVFGVTYLGIAAGSKKPTPQSAVRIETMVPVQGDTRANVSEAFKDLSLTAQSAIVWDVRTQRVLFNKNADDVRPLASITKLMTALVAYELLDPKERIAISEKAIKAEGDSGLRDGEEFTVQNLIDLTLISSSNDGATALGAAAGAAITGDSQELRSEEVFVHAMNTKAEDIGLTRTTFKNSTGLDISEHEAGAFGTAREVALLLEYMLLHTPDILSLTDVERTTIDNEAGAFHTAENTNEVVWKINNLIASKTGYTALAGGNLVVAFDAGFNRPVIVVVLGSTHNGRFNDVVALVEDTEAFMSSE